MQTAPPFRSLAALLMTALLVVSVCPSTAPAISWLHLQAVIAGARVSTAVGESSKQVEDTIIALARQDYRDQQKAAGVAAVGQALIDGNFPASSVSGGAPTTLTFAWLDTTSDLPTSGPAVASVEYRVNTNPYDPSSYTTIGTSTDAGSGFSLVYTASLGEFTIEAIPKDGGGAEIVVSGVDGLNVAHGLAAGLMDSYTVPAKIGIIKPGKLFKLVSKGTFLLPDAATDNPTTEGGSLRVTGTTGSKTYSLPAACWTALGGDGSKGFKCKDAVCTAVIVKPTVIKAVCKPDTGDFGPLPEPGPVSVVLSVGSGTTRYCASCDGTPKGDPAKLFKRKDCPAPPSCPLSPSGAFLDDEG